MTLYDEWNTHDALVTALLEIHAITGQAHPGDTAAELQARLNRCQKLCNSLSPASRESHAQGALMPQALVA